MWTYDNKTIICNYRGFDIYEIGNGFGIQQFYYFKWTILQDAINHIDRHLGGRHGQGAIFWKKTPNNVKENIKESITKENEIKEIYNKIKMDIEKGELKIVTDGLLTLIGECYSKDLIDNNFIESVKDNLDKLEKIMGYVSSTNINEAKVANNKSLQICDNILISINNQVKIA